MLQLGKWDAAVVQLRHALEAGPDDRMVRTELIQTARHCLLQGQKNAARELYLAYLAIHPKDGAILELWENLQDSTQARVLVETAKARPGQYRVSAIVSTYADEAFIKECLDNLLAQSIGTQLEIVVIDAASPENESAIVKDYQTRHANITYLRTRERIGVYPAWNIGITHATGTYCLSMSTNDQLVEDGCERLARVLDEHPSAVLAYGNTYLTHEPHETIERNSHYGSYRWGPYSFPNHLEKGCWIGPHPMWRRSVHQTVGYFDERYIADGDQEFWMRLGSQFPFAYIDHFTGLQWITEDSLSGRGRIPLLEVAVIQSQYRQATTSSTPRGAQGRIEAAGGAAARTVSTPSARGRHINDGDNPRNTPLVSAIVSTYNAEKYIRGCLESLLAQTIAPSVEIIVIDSASPQGEGDIVREFQASSPDRTIRYLRTENRESVYAAWNRGIKLATGKYITNANTDDRLRRDALEHMTQVMEACPDIDLVYADVIKTGTANQTFDRCTPTGVLCWPDWDRQRLLAEGCFIGPQPVWRREVHERYGYFDERYSISADYEFWLRISQSSCFHHLSVPLGLYLEREDSVEHRNPKKKRQQDREIVETYRDPSRQGDMIMLTPETILAGICRMAEDKKYQAVAAWGLEKLITDYPDHAAVHNNRAVLAFEQGDFETACRHYERAAALAPDNARFQKDLGDFYMVQNQSGLALAQFERVLSLQPNHVETLMAAGHLNVAIQNFTGAHDYYQRVLTIDPLHDDARRFFDRLQARKTESIQMATSEELYTAATKEITAGRVEEAVTLLKQLVSQDPEHALGHNDLGVLCYRKGDPEEALAHYQQAVTLEPENITFQKNLADFHWVALGDIKQAMEIYVRALTLDPRDTETLLSCGKICMQLGKNDDARAFVISVIEKEPWNETAQKMLDQLDAKDSADPSVLDHDALYRQALDKAGKGDTKGAIDDLNLLVPEEPHKASLYNDLGVLYYQQGEKISARDNYEKAVELAPDEPTSQKNLADFYLMEEGRIEDALKLYVRVLEKNPQDVDSLLATGLVCIKMNNLNEARSFYQRAQEIEPWNANVREAMERLERLETESGQSQATSFAM